MAALARFSSACYVRGSITKSNAPFFTISPSVKCTDCKYPLTRARTSTDSTASSRPVYSSHSTTSRTTGWLTVTFGGGGLEGCCCVQVVSSMVNPANTHRNARCHNFSMVFASTGVVNILARLASFPICLPRFLCELDQLIQDLRAQLDAGRPNPQQ